MAKTKNKRPKAVEDEHLKFLNDLRESNTTNMMAGPQYLQSAFGLNRAEAKEVFFYWTRTFGQKDR